MATRRYGLSRGDRRASGGVLEEAGGATNADTVELTVDLADGLNKYDVMQAIDQIKEKIARSIWPPV